MPPHQQERVVLFRQWLGIDDAQSLDVLLKSRWSRPSMISATRRFEEFKGRRLDGPKSFDGLRCRRGGAATSSGASVGTAAISGGGGGGVGAGGAGASPAAQSTRLVAYAAGGIEPLRDSGFRRPWLAQRRP